MGHLSCVLSELSLQIMTLVSVIVGVGVIKLHSQSCSQFCGLGMGQSRDLYTIIKILLEVYRAVSVIFKYICPKIHIVTVAYMRHRGKTV